MSLEFKLHQLYRTRDGRKAQIFMLDNGNGNMLGCVQVDDGSWQTQSWPKSGSFAASLCVNLVSEWPDLESDFAKVNIAGVDYYDAKKDCTHREALDLAAKHGLRVMESWEMHKLWVESEEFRNSLQKKGYWCASVYSDSRSFAWQFNGDYGYVFDNYRNYSGAVRMIARDANS